MDVLNGVELFGIPAVTLIIWCSAGLVAGMLLMGRRPIGLLGDLIVGVLGGFLAGWVVSKTGFDLGQYISGIESAALKGYLVAFLTALIGAVVVLIILRVLIRRR